MKCTRRRSILGRRGHPHSLIKGGAMKHSLLLFTFAVITISQPAQGQYIYIDVNGDGLSYEREIANGNSDVAVDFLSPEVIAVDVWYVTNQNYDGTDATCAADPSKNMTIQAYRPSSGM